MSCGVYWTQLHNVERDLDTLRRLGVEESHPAFQSLWQQRGELLARIGHESPRVIIEISHEEVLDRLHALGLEYASGSPGFTAEELKKATVKVHYDIESGWFTEGRLTPLSLPVYHMVDDETAIRFIKHEETGADIAHALVEDDYLGE